MSNTTEVKVNLVEVIKTAVVQLERSSAGFHHLQQWLKMQYQDIVNINICVDIDVEKLVSTEVEVVNRKNSESNMHEHVIHAFKNHAANHESMHASMHAADDDGYSKTLEALGFDEKMIRNILNRYPAELVAKHLDYTSFAAENGKIYKSKAAYFFGSITKNWNAPKGYQAQAAWYTDAESELFVR